MKVIGHAMLMTILRATYLSGVTLAMALMSAQATEIRRGPTLESVEVLGQRVVFSNPSGYCTPGSSPRELELMEKTRRTLPSSTLLIHAAIPCGELEEYRSMRREHLDHWLQVQLIRSKGGFQRLEIPRETFLAALDKSGARLNSAQLGKRLNESLAATSNITISDVQFDSIGRDGNAVYYSLRMNVSVGQATRTVTAISGFTLLNALPLSVAVYEGTGTSESRSQLLGLQQELLQSLLTEN